VKIGLVTQWFDPETGPAALPGVYAREFIRMGHRVKVLTGFPNYPEGRVYPGYRIRPRLREKSESGVVVRVPLYPDHGDSAVGRVANYGSYALSAVTLGAGALAGADAMWAYNSPITVSLPLLAHSRLGRVPYFLHVQDLWPDSLVSSGMFDGHGRAGRSIVRTVESITRLTESRASAIGVISPSVKQVLLDRNPRLEPGRIHCVLNPTDESLFFPRPPDPELERAPWRAPFTVMYAGAIGTIQGFDTVLDAARRLRDRPEIRFVFVGDGIDVARLRRRANDENLHNVCFLRRVEKERVPAYMASSDAQLISLRGDGFLRYTVPSKIATILASGVPILGQIAGDGASLIADSGGGLVISPGDVDGMCDAICRLADTSPEDRRAMGRRGRRYYEATMSARAAATTVVEALTKAAR
jgi:colanic acid biosynthesis glycosyl transferase WcaI